MTSDAQAHGVLLMAARARIAEAQDFTVSALLTETGISRAQFRRCFAGKKQLLAALTEAGAKELGGILQAAQPVALARAVGSDITPVPAPALPPAGDAWLERRLRVFERALAALEKRQEKSEQEFLRQLALLSEKHSALAAAPQARALPPEPLLPVFDPAESNLLPADLVAPQPAPAESVPTQPGEEAGQTPAAPAPTVLAHIEEISAADAAPITDKEINDFIAHARKVAQAATPVEPPRRRRRGRLREAVTLSLILVGGLLVISATLLLASAGPRAMPITAVSHRQSTRGDFAHVIALADSGNAAAQTGLALAYLRSGDKAAASRWSLAAAVQGQPLAQYLLGTMEMEDSNNPGRDSGEAVRWLAAAARQGNIKAMHNLAIAYAQGTGVPQDAALAAGWFTRAATLGYRDSQFDLAVLYERGLGVAQSGPMALKWYLIAAGEGDGPSAMRAAALKAGMDLADVRLVSAEAAGFVPLPANRPANALPDS